MEKLTKTRTGISANNTDQNKKKDDDNALQQEELIRTALEDLLNTESKLREAIDAKQESKHQWRIRQRGLRCSNWKLELENTKIREQTDSLDKEILSEVERSEKDNDEIANLKSQKRQKAADFWTHFQQETKRYSQLLPNAQMEYSADCLKQDIEACRQKSKNVCDKIARVQRYIDSVEAKYGLAELGTNKDARILDDFDVAKKIISDKSNLLRATRSTEDNINVLKLTVKQKKQDIAYLKNKTRNNN